MKRFTLNTPLLKDILLITPPFTQLNTPYPATVYLKGFLNSIHIDAFQMDLGIEVILRLFSDKGLQQMFDYAKKQNSITSPNTKRIYALRASYIETINAVILFLQGKNITFARQICSPDFLPKASRFNEISDSEEAFGEMGFTDKAKHFATLYLEDISDFIIECVDEKFGFSRYAERIGMSANSFDELYAELQTNLSYIDNITLEILAHKLQETKASVVGFAVPFPGNLYSAFRCAQYIKTQFPNLKIIMGGGFPNTELRSISDPRVFDFFDFITLDDGELPLEILLKNVIPPNGDTLETKLLKRTFLRENGEVVYNNQSTRNDYAQHELSTPDYSDLLLDKYISTIQMTNPMHSLWSDGRWNKLTMAHGCYWGRCTFCDVSLDYIKKYEPIAATLLVDRMELMIAQTGERGFHFVDEAAPPAMMRAIALEILKRKLTLTWWTNVRFEKSFTLDLCYLLKASGCIAVSGGLEVASKRLLSLINKGVTLEQVAQVTHNFTQSGILVHAYLMHGFPTQTVQETVDSLEVVRQLFELGIVQSAFWHQFALTAHSPVGLNPTDFHITPTYKPITFANNDIQFKDKTNINHNAFSFGLKKSLYNYMHGIGFELPLWEWFDVKELGYKLPKTIIAKDFIRSALHDEMHFNMSPSTKIIWLGSAPEIQRTQKTKKGTTWHLMQLTFHTRQKSFTISVDENKGEWLAKTLVSISVQNNTPQTFGMLKANFESQMHDFELFWFSKPVQTLRSNGLLALT